MSIKTSFSIKDLENLSGVKAHTIRIWEKRYNLLSPERSDTNIRSYNQESLQKLLNVSLLLQNGYKISHIAAYEEDDLYKKVRELAVDSENAELSINSFKLSMLNFDQQLFDHTFNQLLTQNSFRDIFLKVFLKLLEEIGLLWMTKTITPAHEHFISNLIKQKLLINIERVQHINYERELTFVLYLPINEIHELGLMYIHFELLLKGYKSIYLGPSVPMSNLKELQKTFSNIKFISYFTTEPEVSQVIEYLIDIDAEVLSPRGEKMLILGRNTRELSADQLPDAITVHKDILELVDSI